MLAVCLIRRGRIDEARPYVIPERERPIAEGDEASVSWVCMYLAELEWLAGNWDLAEAYAREGEEVAEQAGMRMRIGTLRNIVALVEASRGDPTRARELGTRRRRDPRRRRRARVRQLRARDPGLPRAVAGQCRCRARVPEHVRRRAGHRGLEAALVRRRRHRGAGAPRRPRGSGESRGRARPSG